MLWFSILYVKVAITNVMLWFSILYVTLVYNLDSVCSDHLYCMFWKPNGCFTTGLSTASFSRLAGIYPFKPILISLQSDAVDI